jgi:O-antigen ligase
VFKNPLYLPIALYLTLATALLFWASKDISSGIALYRSILSGFLTYFLVANLIKTERQFRAFVPIYPIWGVVLSVTTVVYIALTQPNFGMVLINKDTVRVVWGKNNYLAAFWALIIPLAISMSLSYRGLKRWLGVISVIVMFSALVLTRSRGGFTSLAAVLFIYLLFFVPKLTYKIALSVLLVGVVLINPATSPLFRRFGRLAANIGSLDATGDVARLTLWKGSLQAFTKSPLWGVGLDNVGFYIEKLTGYFVIHPHNYILKVLSETGLIGLGLVAWMFFLIFKNLIFLREKFKFDYYWGNLSAGFLASFCAAILHSMVEPTFEGVQYSIVFWSMAGATFAMRNVLANSSELAC